uniref:Neurensin 1-like n=1 Tax=Eptatretus burgeri TaxID=7764 RepID=A0A8C4WY78_EPTBU
MSACCGRVDMPETQPRYGVRSYLHQFYADCTGATACEEEASKTIEEAKRPHDLRCSFARKVALLSAAILTLWGLLAFVVAAPISPRIETISGPHFIVVDSRAAFFNHIIATARASGMVLMGLGGALLVAVILATCLAVHWDPDRDQSHEISSCQHNMGPLPPQPKAGDDGGVPVSLATIWGVQPSMGMETNNQ